MMTVENLYNDYVQKPYAIKNYKLLEDKQLDIIFNIKKQTISYNNYCYLLMNRYELISKGGRRLNIDKFNHVYSFPKFFQIIDTELELNLIKLYKNEERLQFIYNLDRNLIPKILNF